jgi:hypothetical protein
MPPSLDDRTGQFFGSSMKAITNFDVYADAVPEYTRRQMSFLEDGLNAVSGVLSHFSPWFRGEFLSGLPLTELDQALLWYPKGNITRRKDRLGNDLFPSWSWIGWVGQCRYVPGLALSCIRWRAIDRQSWTYHTSDDLRNPANDRELIIFRRNWTKMEFNDSTEHSTTSRSLTYNSCWYEQTAPGTRYLHPISVRSARIAHPASGWKDGSLEFQALFCFFNVTGDHAAEHEHSSPDRSNHYYDLRTLSIHDAMGHVCGSVHVPASLSASVLHGQHEFIRLSRTHLEMDHSRHSDLDWHPDGTFRLSEGQPQESESPDNSNKSARTKFELPEGRMFDTDAFDTDEPWCVYNVMLVKTTHGISRRVGLGKMHVAAFTEKEGGARWRDVVLA